LISPQGVVFALKRQLERWNGGDKKRSAAGGLISDLPIVSKKDLIFLNPLFQHSIIPSFHGICPRHSQFTLTWPRGPDFLILNKNSFYGVVRRRRIAPTNFFKR
jgi:hypothetical protein